MQYDKRQLLKDAFDLKETFKVPTGFWHHFVLGPDQFRADTDPAIRDRIVEGHRKYYQLVNPDMMKMMNEGFMGYPPIMDNPLETPKRINGMEGGIIGAIMPPEAISPAARLTG